MNHETLGAKIVTVASRFLNLREVRPNSSWDNPKTPGPDTELSKALILMMRPAPWEPGWAYCAAFVEGVVATAIHEVGGTQDQMKKWRDTSTAHVMTNFNRFKELGIVKPYIGRKMGSIWLAQHNGGSQGHTGILVGGNAQAITTIEANTSKDVTSGDKDREGDWITTRTFNPVGRGVLRTKGFICIEALCNWLNE